MGLGKLSIAGAIRAPLWIRLAVFGVIGAMFAASVAATIGQARGFATDQYKRGETYGRTAVALDVSNETTRIRDRAEADLKAANERQMALRAQSLAELGAMKEAYDRALKEAQDNDPSLAEFFAMPVPRSLRDDAEDGDDRGSGSGS